MSGEVYNIPGEEQGMEMCCESAGPQAAELKFIKATVEAVVEALNIGYRDRRIVQSLLERALSEKMDRRYKSSGLLQQYEAYVLDLATERLRKELEIPEEIKINHSHATHAKLADIVDYLKQNYVLAEKKTPKEGEKRTDEITN